MDLHEHGISAYPEYEISPFASPSGLADAEFNAAERPRAFRLPPWLALPSIKGEVDCQLTSALANLTAVHSRGFLESEGSPGMLKSSVVF